MPLPVPKDGEERGEFLTRCLRDDTVSKEFPDTDQRVAVCFTQWRRGKREPMNLNAAFTLTAVPSWLAAEDVAQGQSPRPPRFSMIAYTGGPMKIDGFDIPVIVELSGIRFAQRIPIKRGHWDLIGHSEAISVENGKLVATGVISFENDESREVTVAARNGFPWQASIGAKIARRDLTAAGERVTVNGQEHVGPVHVVRACDLNEISFVDIGADRRTSATVAAKAANQEPPEMPENETAPVPITAAPAADAVAAIRADAAAELDRLAGIRKAADGHTEIAAQAVREGWSIERTQLACTQAKLEELRAARPPAPGLNLSAPPLDENVLTAAACMATGGLSDMEKQFKPETLDAAHTRFKRRMSLHRLIAECAAKAGVIVTDVRNEWQNAIKAGFTTMSLPNVLANVQNKYLQAGFFSVERAWESISAFRSLKDFKPAAGVRFGGDFKLKTLAPSGEIEHASVSEQTFANQLETKARMIAITRTMFINDDLGAVADVPRHLGRGAGLQFNVDYWTEFIENAEPFFSGPNGNFDDGADTSMSIESIGDMITMFARQTDYDGNPLGSMLRFLVFPPELWDIAFPSLMSSVITIGGTEGTRGTNNPLAGRLVPVQSSYLSNANITGFSGTAFFGLADPMDIPMIEVGFLDGVRTPTIESDDTVFDTLGVQSRVWWDYGIRKQEKKAAIKFAGA